jgi:hypothetical protein
MTSGIFDVQFVETPTKERTRPEDTSTRRRLNTSSNVITVVLDIHSITFLKL